MGRIRIGISAMQSKIDADTAADFAKVIDQYSEDNTFWSFVGSFAATVGYDLASGDAERAARLVAECARQYAYLRDEHRAYFKRLCSQTDLTNRVYEMVASVAIRADLPAQHFANNGFLGYVFRTAKAEHIATEAREAAMARRPTATTERPAPSALAPTDAFQVPTGGLSCDDLAALARDFYAQSKGRLIKVYDYSLEGGGAGTPERTSSIFRDYDIAIIEDGGEDNVGAEFENGKAVESIWPVVMLTGPNRGLRAEVVAPEFWYDGSVLENEVCLDFLPGYIVRERLTDEEMIELVRLDMADYSEMSVGIIEATAYIGNTDRQEECFFDPPLPSVIEAFDPSLRNFSAMYRLDGWSSADRIKVIDVFVDFDSPDERAEGYRSMWTHGISYTSHGVIDPGKFPLLPFIPSSVPGRRLSDEIIETAPVTAI